MNGSIEDGSNNIHTMSFKGIFTSTYVRGDPVILILHCSTGTLSKHPENAPKGFESCS